MNLRLLFLFLGISILLPVNTLHAQSVSMDISEYRTRFLGMLASDLFITEGAGLKRVHIGQSYTDLIKSLGTPKKKKRQGIFSGLVIYTFQLDKETAVQVGIKNKRVSAIAFAGSALSQYATVKGARFEMPAREVIRYYGGGKLKRNKLLYQNKGVRFDFKGGKLKVIRIFAKR